MSLICSGDAQIYAMAALAYELLDATGPRAVSDVARRVNLETHPGVSAFQAASAAAAPIQIPRWIQLVGLPVLLLVACVLIVSAIIVTFL